MASQGPFFLSYVKAVTVLPSTMEHNRRLTTTPNCTTVADGQTSVVRTLLILFSLPVIVSHFLSQSATHVYRLIRPPPFALLPPYVPYCYLRLCHAKYTGNPTSIICRETINLYLFIYYCLACDAERQLWQDRALLT